MTPRPRADTPGGSTPSGGQIRHRNPILRHGFAQVPRPVLKARGLSDKAKLVYWLLLDYSWQGDSCYPGQQRMADDLSTSLASITRALRELRAYGLITWERRGNQQTNVYWIEDFSENPRLAIIPPGSRDSSPTTNQSKTPREYRDSSPATTPDSSPATTPDSSPVTNKEYPEERYSEEGYRGSGQSSDPNLSSSDVRQGIRAHLQDRVDVAELLGEEATSEATISLLARLYRQFGRENLETFALQMDAARTLVASQMNGRGRTRGPGRPRSPIRRWLDALEDRLSRDDRTDVVDQIDADVASIPPAPAEPPRDTGLAEHAAVQTLGVSTRQVWAAALEDLRQASNRKDYATWLDPTALLRVDGATAVVGAPSSYGARWLADHLEGEIARALAGVLGRRVQVRFEVADDASSDRRAAR